MSRTGRAALLVALTGSAALAATAVVGPVSAHETDRELRAAKAIASKFTSVKRAQVHGYSAPVKPDGTLDCVDHTHAPPGAAPDGSYMGYHYVDRSSLDRSLEPRRPEAVLYKRGADGSMVLTGIEYIVVADDQTPPYDEDHDRPSLWGHAFQGPMPGHFPGMPAHYDLHVWTHDHNPAGAWTPWNTSTDLRCP